MKSLLENYYSENIRSVKQGVTSLQKIQPAFFASPSDFSRPERNRERRVKGAIGSPEVTELSQKIPSRFFV